jgi:peptide/nickel transport system substrate-binding protein
MRFATIVAAAATIATLAAASAARTQAPGLLLRVGHADLGTAGPRDPQLVPEWALHITHLRLVAYPDVERRGATRLVAEAAERLPTLSPDGRTYVFTIRDGLRFSDGSRVRAANFAFALARGYRPELHSPNQLMPIAGAGAVMAGKRTELSGVRARGSKLTVTLERPDPTFLHHLSHVPAIPLGLPTPPGGLKDLVATAGPYQPEELSTTSVRVRRNPHWNRAAIPWRPARFDAIEWIVGGSDEQRVRMLERGELDLVYVGAGALARDLAERYGVNRERFFVKPLPNTWFVTFNHARPLFRGNAPLRRAINYALDRPQLVRQFGPLGGRRTDQFLPPTLPGFREANIYPLEGARVARARELARRSLRGGKAILYNRTGQLGTLLGQVLAFNLEQIGLAVEVRAFEPPVLFDRMSRPDEPWDLSVYGLSYAFDPGAWLAATLHGRSIRFEDGRNVGLNLGRFDDPVWNRRIDEASQLEDQARLAALGGLEHELMRRAAPVAPFMNVTWRMLVSPRVGCFTWHAEGYVDFVALCPR